MTAPQTGPTRRTRKREANTEAALEAARGFLRTVGYAAMTMGQVAADADVDDRTLYRHFGSKDGLVMAAVNLWPLSIVDPNYDEDRIYPHPDYKLIQRIASDPLNTGFIGAMVEYLCASRPEFVELAGHVAAQILDHR